MIKVVPYIKTLGSDKFKNFLNEPFTVDMLYPVFNENSVETIFDCWREKNMVTWYRFINDDKIVLEYYPTYFIIKKEQNSFKAGDSISYRLPIPRTINQFINTMEMFAVQLYWTEWIEQNFEPKDYLPTDGIKNYYIDFFSKIGKSEELL